MQEEEWRAITQCDPAYDGQFYYAVKTTGIFCRPSCKSRVPNRGNVIVFHSAHAAVEAGFRACKRCRPDQCHGPAAELVQRALDYMAVHYSEPLTLSLIARGLHIDPYHLHHTFKRMVGATPVAYLRSHRLLQAGQLLAESDLTITEIALRMGFGSGAHFATVFRKQHGQSPSAYRRSVKEGK